MILDRVGTTSRFMMEYWVDKFEMGQDLVLMMRVDKFVPSQDLGVMMMMKKDRFLTEQDLTVVIRGAKSVLEEEEGGVKEEAVCADLCRWM